MKRQVDRRRRRLNPDGTPRKCGGTNIYGDPCGASPLKKGTLVEGIPATGDYCLMHDPSIPADAWKRLWQEKGVIATKNRPRSPHPFERLEMAIRKAPGLLFRAHLESLGLLWDEDTQEIVENPDNPDGAKVFGFSREGYVRMSKHRDLEAQMRAAERLKDRLFGKPRTAVDIAAGGSGMAMVTIPMDDARATKVAAILMSAGAVQGGLVPAATDDGDSEDIEREEPDDA